LLETGDLPIVEDSRKDDFWGAKPEDEEILTGANVLGRLLMQVREQIKTGEITSETIVKPLPIQNFLLYGQEISSVSANSEYHLDNYRDLLDFNKVNNQPDSEVVLPDTPMLESDFNGKNTINSHVSAESIESEHQKYDASQIMMPYIIGSLKTERTDKELVEIFENTDLKIMRKWLDRAVEIGKVRKLTKPVRYIAESQLPLIN
ncbi:MAG: NADAR domain-containing protein, partial [Pseudanabaena sp.]